jgi:predicted 3-demethylubiquinone-9 3-methyltransferase (glyoxalase superfamily)
MVHARRAQLATRAKAGRSSGLCPFKSAEFEEQQMAKIVPHLWYSEKAEEAARFYASVIPDSRVDSVTTLPADTPSGPEGSVQVVEFTLAGQPFLAINAGPLDPFNHAISFVINCDTQDEIDRLWSALSAGGSVERCGWLKDRYGVSWQIVPSVLGRMMKDSDKAKARRVAQAMLKMVKLDIAQLQAAYAGTS